MPVYALFLTHADGYVQVLTFWNVADRVAEQIMRRFEPVTMRTADY
jgi:hypothetical protein